MQWQSFFRECIKPMQPYQPGLREEQICEIAQTDEIYKLSSNESPLPPFPSALEAMAQALPSLNRYPDGSCHLLRLALSRHYGVKSEQIMLGNGTNELLTLIAMTCLEPGDNVVYAWPSFVVYRYAAQLLGANFREVPLAANGSFDLDAMLEQVDQRTKVVYVCSPNNPSGACVAAVQMERFLERLPNHVLVVLDAAYDEFVCRDGGDNPVNPLAFYDGVRPLVVLKTFSKAYALAGIRVGFGFAPEPLVQAVERVREPFNVNAVAQAAAVASLADKEELARRLDLNAACRARLEAGLAKLNLKYYPSQANFVWLEVANPDLCFNQLLRRGVIVRPILGVGALRIGVGDQAGVSQTLAALEELFG